MAILRGLLLYTNLNALPSNCPFNSSLNPSICSTGAEIINSIFSSLVDLAIAHSNNGKYCLLDLLNSKSYIPCSIQYFTFSYSTTSLPL